MAAPGKLEVGNKIEHDALGHRFFQALVQFEGEIGRQHVAIIAGHDLRRCNVDLCGPRQYRQENQQ